MRFDFLAAQDRRPDQFTILCRCIPDDPDESVKGHVDHFFRVNHPDYYLLNAVVYNANTLSKLVKKKAKLQNKVTYFRSLLDKNALKTPLTIKKGFLGLWGEEVDRLSYYLDTINRLTDEIHKERIKVLQDKESVMPAAFVSFETRWAAAVCSQTKQSKDSTKWLTEWAPEPRDVYWANLPIPYLQLSSRRLVTLVALFFVIFFFLIPLTLVQSLANLDKLERNLPFLRPLIEKKVVKSVLQGFLPGLSLKIFLLVLPFIVLGMSIFEGRVSYSQIEKHAAIKFLVFMLINIFLGNIVTGSVFEQLKLFLQNPPSIPSVLAKAIPMRAPFFITYIMVDGWTHCATDLVRPVQLIIYHIRNSTMVRTERDRDRAIPVGSIQYITAIPRLGLYILLGLVYSTISPLIIPFILVYLAVAYVVYRNQIINAYEQTYESAGAYWPILFSYVILALLVMHSTLIGLMALKEAAMSTPFLLPLPCCTILFWFYCGSRFKEAFHCYALEEAKAKDTVERAREPNLDVREFLEGAYMHPVLRTSLTEGEIAVSDSDDAVDELLHNHLAPSKAGSSHRTNEESQRSGGSASGKELATITKDCEEGTDRQSARMSSPEDSLLRHQEP